MAQRYELHPGLKEYIKYIFIVNFTPLAPGQIPAVCTFLPRHTRFLCFYLQDSIRVSIGGGAFTKRADCLFVGPMIRPVRLDFGAIRDIIFVALKPCILHRFLHRPLDAIVGLDVDARDVFSPSEVDELFEQLRRSRNNSDKNTMVQRFLQVQIRSLSKGLLFDLAIQELEDAGGNLSVEYLASRSCMSTRQFERQAHIRLGLPPKLYARIVRFSMASKLRINRPELSWTDISSDCGYFDQMHFIRDFKEFAGMKPGMFQSDNIRPNISKRSMVV